MNRARISRARTADGASHDTAACQIRPAVSRRQFLQAVAGSATLAALALLPTGCSVLGLGAQALSRNYIKAAYPGLKGQTVTVMVSTDRATRTEHPMIQLDVGQAIINGLKAMQANKVEELEGTTFPASASALNVYTYQRNYPQVEAEQITDVAPRFGVSRVIYVEIDSFSLNPSEVLDLFRGEASARVRVLEVANGKASVAYDDRVTAKFPEKAPEVGTPNLDRRTTYLGTLQSFMTQTVRRFATYEE
jgi:hypothetical protein